MYDMRIGERLYTFSSFSEGCKAIAIHCRFIGNQDELEELMKEKGIDFKLSDIEDNINQECRNDYTNCK